MFHESAVSAVPAATPAASRQVAPSFKLRIAPDGTIMERTKKGETSSGMRWDWK